jgi:HAE1 family hydrophobic/amphiphilic exporter-1
MKLPEFAVNRPVTTFMTFLIIVIISVISVKRIAVDMFPDVDFPVVLIIAEYPGVAPEEIETLITEHIEEQVAVVDGVRKIKASSLEGLSMFMVEFEWGTNLDIAAQNIRNRIDIALSALPDDIERPLVIKWDMDMLPVVYYGVISKTGRDLRNLKKLLEDMVEKRLESLPGVASVSIMGGREREIVIEIDRDRLNAHKLPILEVINRINAQNVDIPGGHITRGGNELVIRTIGKYKNLDEIRDTILIIENGQPVYVKDVANVWDGYKEIRNYARTNRVPSALFMVNKEPGANTIRVANEVKRELKRIEKTLPSDIEVIRNYDTSSLIKTSVSQLRESAIWGALFAIGVIYLFLFNFISTFTLALTIFFSVTATFIPIYFFGYTINMMTLSGLALAIGMIVDDSIVVLENIFRHMQEGKERREAAIIGTAEVGMAVTTSTLTTIVVFLPMALATGLFGIIIRPLGLTVIFAMLASLLVALTLVPMLISRTFRTIPEKKEDRIFPYIRENYRSLISWTLGHRFVTIFSAVLIFVLSIYFLTFVGTEFIPKLDEEAYTGVIKLTSGTSLEKTNNFVYEIEKEIMNQQELDSVISFVGASEATTMDIVFGVGPAGVNEGVLYWNLIPKGKRKISGQEFIEGIRSKIPQLEGAIVYFMDTMDWFAHGGERAVEVKVFGRDREELRRIGDNIVKELEKIEGICDIDNSLRMRRPEFQIVVDREKASQMGITVQDIASTVEAAFLGKETATKYREGGDEYDIRVRFKEPYKKTFEDLKDVVISSPMDFQVKLSDITKVYEGRGPARIDREEQERIVKVSANIFGRDLGSVMEDVEKKIDILPLPEGYYLKYGGAYEDMKEMQAATMGALVLIILLVYMILASQFEAFLHPFVIILTVPFALIGVVLSLILSKTTLSLTSFIGLLMVIGVVTKNGILLVDYINQLRAKGFEVNEAIIQGGAVRLRPILMTAITTIFACIPMSFSRGEGAELFSPIGITILGGLTTNTFLTLLIMPALYSSFNSLVESVRKRFKRKIHGQL